MERNGDSQKAESPPLFYGEGIAGGAHLVRIRIYGIIGFSGFFRRVFDRQALVRIRFGEISRCGEKRMQGETKILKIPPILKILILTKTRGHPIVP